MVATRLLIFSITFLGLAAVASAHTLETSSSVGAALHVDPLDEPVAGQPSTLFFDLKQKDASFDGSGCVCTLTIKGSTTNLLASNVSADAKSSGSSLIFPYIFPQPDTYTVTLYGIPKAEAHFAPFQLPFEVKVSGALVKTNTTSPRSFWGIHFIHLAVFLVGVAIILGNSIVAERRKKK